eukprot:m.25973 g.25973  ORF g.25973 m.25973 type:complete len:775 (+) comp4517_c0_seq1:364-2688(+)
MAEDPSYDSDEMDLANSTSASRTTSQTASASARRGSSWAGSGSASSSAIRVVVRVRPLSSAESARRDAEALECADDKQTVAVSAPSSSHPSKTYTFNSVMGPDVSQEEVFNTCGVKHLVDSALEGYACTAFAFGQTGSGKTYTITGPDSAVSDPSGHGIIQRACGYLVDRAAAMKDMTVRFTASYIEIYNEQVLDLLNPTSGRGKLPIRWKADRGFYVENLFIVECETADDMLAILQEGLLVRRTSAHDMNERSSRSHSILTIYIHTASNSTQEELGGAVLQRNGQISFVDLAGSERVNKTKSHGQQLVESNNINKSLLILGNCISSLADPKKRNGHIPYRESALTMLLKDSLGGSGMTLMIACVSPAITSAQETSNTLRYASRAKRIQNKPVIRMDPQQQLILALQREIRLLQTECKYLREQVNGGRGILGSGQSLSAAALAAIEEATEGSTSHDPTLEHRIIAPIAQELTQTKVLLQQYMQDNEDLRVENVFLYGQQKIMKEQYEEVMRDNERLLRRMQEASINATSSGDWQSVMESVGRQDTAFAIQPFDKSYSTLHRQIAAGEFSPRIGDDMPEEGLYQHQPAPSSGSSGYTSEPSKSPTKSSRPGRAPKRGYASGSGGYSGAASGAAAPSRLSPTKSSKSVSPARSKGAKSQKSPIPPLDPPRKSPAPMRSQKSLRPQMLPSKKGKPAARPTKPNSLPAHDRSTAARQGGRRRSDDPGAASGSSPELPISDRSLSDLSSSSQTSMLKLRLRNDVDEIEAEILRTQMALR